MNAVVFLHGCPAVGKTTIANHLHKLVDEGHELAEEFLECIVLDGDILRQLWPELGFSEEDRVENHKRAALLATVIGRQTLATLIVISMIGPTAEARDTVKTILETSSEHFSFIDVYLDCPVEEREHRDPKGLYKLAKEGKITNLTGYNGRYDVPLDYGLRFDTSRYDANAIATAILSNLA